MSDTRSHSRRDRAALNYANYNVGHSAPRVTKSRCITAVCKSINAWRLLLHRHLNLKVKLESTVRSNSINTARCDLWIPHPHQQPLVRTDYFLSPRKNVIEMHFSSRLTFAVAKCFGCFAALCEEFSCR